MELQAREHLFCCRCEKDPQVILVIQVNVECHFVLIHNFIVMVEADKIFSRFQCNAGFLITISAQHIQPALL
jgi:hypothetical protein